MYKTLILFLLFALILEMYTFQAFKTVTSNTTAKYIYFGINAIAYVVLVYIILNFNRAEQNTKQLHLAMGILTIIILPKIIAVVFLIIDEIIRLGNWYFQWISKENKTSHYPERRKFLSILGLGLTGLASILVTDGIIFGKYRHRARKLKLKLPNLPESFKGYKIVQISDVHSGSFLHPEKLEKAIQLINDQNADLILFTGDMVNNLATEFQPFISLFSKIKSKDGKFSILGNHDYGHYAQWKSKQEELDNLNKLIDFQKQAGFTVLRNENRTIEKNGEKLHIIGVENWGIKPFPQYGDLDKAIQGIPTASTKILMSHDPSHFDEIVKNHPSNIHLTLSGHTHGMQFGLDLKNIKWSPVQYKYPKWADLYQENNKYLYVNRGFGVLAYPGRVGMDPEITLLELC